jgi:CubicO group peptidase (beta-lactamase class C family)
MMARQKIGHRAANVTATLVGALLLTAAASSSVLGADTAVTKPRVALPAHDVAMLHAKILSYVQPYVKSGNFSGSILVLQDGKTLLRDSFGFSDISQQTPNTADTKFHVASLSMPFTAAAVMRLVEKGKLSLETKVSDIVPDVPNGAKITVRQLLQQNSNLPDANDQPDYDTLLASHQTPETLVQFIRGRTPLGEPGGKSQHEEHSAYNLLTLIVEKTSALPFKEAARREVFAPLGMRDSGIDDDSPIPPPIARGYTEKGAVALEDAPHIHWSAKTGNGSAYSTINDERRWIAGFLSDKFLSESARQTMLNDGYGWESLPTSRIGVPIYFQTGQSPSGVSSELIYIPSLRAEIVILSNLEIPVAAPMGFDIAAMLAGGEYHDLVLPPAPMRIDEVAKVVGRYRFGPDFFRPNATLELARGGDGLILKWQGGLDAAVVIADDHHFIDRHYWVRFSVAEHTSGRGAELTYGKFKGQRVSDSAPQSAH